MDWIKQQIKRAWAGLIAAIVAVSVIILRQGDNVAPVLDDLARSMPPPVQIAGELQALDGAFITNSRIIQYVPSGSRTLDAALETLGLATDIPWLELIEIYEEIEDHAAFREQVDELLPIVRAQMMLAMIPDGDANVGWENLGDTDFADAMMAGEAVNLLFLGDESIGDPRSAVFMFGRGRYALEADLPAGTTMRSLTGERSPRLDPDRQRVFHFFATDGQIGYVEEHGRMNGMAYCSRPADAGVLQRRSAPASIYDMLRLTVMSRVLADLGETCRLIRRPTSATALFRHVLPDGRSLPQLNAAETEMLGPISLTGPLSSEQWQLAIRELQTPGILGSTTPDG